jgi:hypothetical protein
METSIHKLKSTFLFKLFHFYLFKNVQTNNNQNINQLI